MNILAHAYLSAHHDELVIGNFIGDFIKGDPAAERHGLTPGEIVGVRVHRAIDSFTDTHPTVGAVRELLYPRCHKYAGAAVDIFFDHYLARSFHTLTGEWLAPFVTDFYETIQKHSHRLPPSAARMADYMIRHDWLTSYQHLSGIDRALKGVSRRTAYPSGLDTAIVDLERYFGPIDAYFQSFWKELTQHIEIVRTELLLSVQQG